MTEDGKRVTCAQLAQLLGAELRGPGSLEISTITGIDRGAPGSLTFIRTGKFAEHWADSACSAALVTRDINVPGHDPETRALIIVDDADTAIVTILKHLAPPVHAPEPGVHPSAIVDPSAEIDPTAAVGPMCAIGPGTSVGPGSVLSARVVLGAGVKIGVNTTLRPGVVIEDRCVVGDRCIIHANSVIGSDGFGYLPTPAGPTKIPHAGFVEIGNDVEIGACTTIDRGKFAATRIGDMTKIDNLVQIAHNCEIGQACLIAAGAGVAGSTLIGNGVVLAGHVGVADNLTVGDGATVGANSGVINSVPAQETWLGYPAAQRMTTLRQWSANRKLPEMMRELHLKARHEHDND